MNSNTGNEGEIRKEMIEAGLIDCMVALPAQLFYNTMIPACLWFLARNRKGSPPIGGVGGGLRNRSNEILFIDARKLGIMINRRNKELTDVDLQKISSTYHNWRSLKGAYEDVAGFCKAATMDEVRNNNYVLMPGRYVGTEEEEDDGILFTDKIAALTTKLAEQLSKGHTLETEIRENLKSIGYEF
jgi:type I restriction enzyme M protein